MEQFDTLYTQCRHIDICMKEVGLQKIIIDKMTAMGTKTILPDCITKGLCLFYYSAYTGRSTPITAFDRTF